MTVSVVDPPAAPAASTPARPRKGHPPESVPWLRIWPFLLMQASCLLVFVVGWSPVAVIVCAALYLVRMFGITAFYHRYFSHRTFRVGRGMQLFGAVLGSASTQGGPLWWAAHHRRHHRYSDTERDAHSPHQHGVFWAHFGWFTAKSNFETDLSEVPDLAGYAELRWLDRHFLAVPLALLGACFALGAALAAWAPGLGTDGPQMVVWGFCVSTTLLFHATSAVNSVGHLFGRRVWPTRDQSRNSFWLALVTLGEGWHNNHHWCPGTARQGFRWWEIDGSYYALRLLALFGLVRDLRPLPARARDASRRLSG